MQARLKLEEAGRQVDQYLDDTRALFDGAGSPSIFYPGLIYALNRLVNENVVDKSLRGEYRERLSEALSARIKKALNKKDKLALIEEKEGLEKVIRGVKILQGSGGFLKRSKQKTAVKVIHALMVELDQGIANPKVEQLFNAVRDGNLLLVDQLIKEGVDVNYQNGMTTLLHVAAKKDNATVVQLLLKNKVKVNQVDDHGNTPLYLAALSGDVSIVRALIHQDVGVDVNQGIRGAAVFAARSRNYDAVITLLLEAAIRNLSPLPGNGTIYSSLIAALNHEALKSVYAQRPDLRQTHCAWLTQALAEIVSWDTAWRQAELRGLRAIIEEVDLLKEHGDEGERAVKEIENLIEQLEKREADANTNTSPSALCLAAKMGHLETVKALIARRALVNCQDEQGRVPLFQAAAHGQVAVVEFLVSQKADVNQAENEGATPLYIAAQEGHVEVVQHLLENNADVNQRWEDATPLYIAAQEGHEKVVQVLLQNDNVAVNQAKNNGVTPLFIAAQQGHDKVVEILLENNADVNQARNSGGTPLYIAAQKGHAGIVEALIEKGADVSQIRDQVEQDTALFAAIYKEREAIVAFLLNTMIQKSSASPESQKIYSLLIATLNHEKLKPVYDRNKPLRVMIRTRLAEALTKKASMVVRGDPGNIEEELEGLRAIIKDVNLLNGVDKLGREKHAVKAIKQCIETLEAALNQRKAVEVDPSKALFEAAIEGDLEKVKVLIEKGVEIDCQDEEGRTLLWRAAGRGRVNVVEFLISQKANINQVSNIGATPLYIASQEGHVSVVRALIERGANVDLALKDDGTTPLYIASQQGHVAVVKVLLETGASINQARFVGRYRTPLDIALYFRRSDVVDLIKAELDKKMRSFIPSNYPGLVDYLNGEKKNYDVGSGLRKTLRSLLTLALSDRVKALLEKCVSGEAQASFIEELKADRAGLDVILQELDIIQKKQFEFKPKYSMMTIKALIVAVDAKIANPAATPVIQLSDANKTLFVGTLFAASDGAGKTFKWWGQQGEFLPANNASANLDLTVTNREDRQPGRSAFSIYNQF